MSKQARYENVYNLSRSFFQSVKSFDISVISPEIVDSIERLFNTTTWGYREIVLVIALARFIDPTYRASESFYKCNPRPLYEGPVLRNFVELGIPHRKSGPLNVAKATSKINEQWAAQRRPSDLAFVVVDLVKHIESLNEIQLGQFLQYIHKRFLIEALRIEKLNVLSDPKSNPLDLFNMVEGLINDSPDAGNTPQRVIGYLLQSYHEEIQTGVSVTGHEDRASVTNTTSKKPGDILELQIDGTIIKIYEITVKIFGESRIRESYESIKQYDRDAGTHTQEIIVICRGQDAPRELVQARRISKIFLGKVEYQDVSYYFIDIFEFAFDLLLKMTTDARLAFYEKIQAYISHPNTSEKVKTVWKKLVG